MGLFFRFYSEKQKGAERPVYHADKGEGGASGIIEEGRDMAFKIILFSNQRDPIEEWRAGSRLEALELVARTALPEAIARERAALWFVGEVVAIRIEPEGA